MPRRGLQRRGGAPRLVQAVSAPSIEILDTNWQRCEVESDRLVLSRMPKGRRYMVWPAPGEGPHVPLVGPYRDTLQHAHPDVWHGPTYSEIRRALSHQQVEDRTPSRAGASASSWTVTVDRGFSEYPGNSDMIPASFLKLDSPTEMRLIGLDDREYDIARQGDDLRLIEGP